MTFTESGWPITATTWRGAAISGASLLLRTLSTKDLAVLSAWVGLPSPSSVAVMVIV